MDLCPQSSDMQDYLSEQDIIDYSHPAIQAALGHLSTPGTPETERAKRTYEFVRDHIHHSGDIHSSQVTRSASEVLRAGEGLCYAKAHLLAALLRAQGIPAGFCYQRLTLGDTPDKGHALHGLNAVYLAEAGTWVRLDARGNKPGVQAEFSTEAERLAYIVQPDLGEIDYPTIYARPHPKVVQALRSHSNCLELCEHFLPDSL